MSIVGEFIGMLFFERNVAHAEHINTTFLSKHLALGEFYENVIDLADSFSEKWRGRSKGELIDAQLTWATPDQEIDMFLEGCMEWIEANRYLIVDRNDTPMQNIIDEIVELHLETLYKLRCLM